MHKIPCLIEKQCPWSIKPAVGMWASKLDLFATDCILYTECPRKKWSRKKWKENI